MEIKVKGALFHSPENIENFLVKVYRTDQKDNVELVKKKLISERKKMVDYLRRLKEIGEINSLFKPRNEHIQSQLDNIVSTKKILKHSIETIKVIYE